VRASGNTRAIRIDTKIRTGAEIPEKEAAVSLALMRAKKEKKKIDSFGRNREDTVVVIATAAAVVDGAGDAGLTKVAAADKDPASVRSILKQRDEGRQQRTATRMI